MRLETERLILRRYELSDADDMFANWVTDSEVTRFWSWEPHENISITKALLLQWTDEYKNVENYHWVIVRKATMQAIGSIYLSEIDNAEGRAEVHCLLSRAYWNQGLMTEACQCVIAFAFDEVGFRTIRSHHHEQNPASGRVMQKCGMKQVKREYRQSDCERLNGTYHYYEIHVRNEGGRMNYYAEKLNSISLFHAYDTALPRVQQYLDAEIAYVQSHLSGQEALLEIGAGYGRIIKQLSPYAERCLGIDISERSVQLGNEYVQDCQNCSLAVMDAHHLSFGQEFDIVLCLQNGLSAMKGEAENLIRQSLQVLRPGGKAFFSTYSPKFWEPRLQWFREQASKGLLGEIDETRTKDGVIICKDGFRADTFAAEQLDALGTGSACRYHLQEVDESSLFLVLYKN